MFATPLQNFAWQEMRILLAHFVNAFEFRLAKPEEKVEPKEKFIIVPATPSGRLDFVLRRRVVA